MQYVYLVCTDGLPLRCTCMYVYICEAGGVQMWCILFVVSPFVCPSGSLFVCIVTGRYYGFICLVSFAVCGILPWWSFFLCCFVVAMLLE